IRPNLSTDSLTADSASAGLVISSFTTNRSEDLPRAWATLSVLRPVATTLWPAARAALAIYTPIPRPAPVISQTLLMSLLLNNDPSNGSVGVWRPITICRAEVYAVRDFARPSRTAVTWRCRALVPGSSPYEREVASRTYALPVQEPRSPGGSRRVVASADR